MTFNENADAITWGCFPLTSVQSIWWYWELCPAVKTNIWWTCSGNIWWPAMEIFDGWKRRCTGVDWQEPQWLVSGLRRSGRGQRNRPLGKTLTKWDRSLGPALRRCEQSLGAPQRPWGVTAITPVPINMFPPTHLTLIKSLEGIQSWFVKIGTPVPINMFTPTHLTSFKTFECFSVSVCQNRNTCFN